MTDFKIHSPHSAPVEAQKLLDNSLHKYGVVPNLHGGLAESPAALQAYLELTRLFDSTSLTPAERQVVLIAASVENHCSYCVAAHSMIARQMVKIDSAVVDALRQGQPLPDSKLEVLAVFTRAVVKQRGMVTGKPLADFISADYNRAQVLDVVLGVAMKTLSNYTNHIIDTPLDKQSKVKPGITQLVVVTAKRVLKVAVINHFSLEIGALSCHWYKLKELAGI